MTTEQRRAERAQQGSRRKRDIQAAGLGKAEAPSRAWIDAVAWAKRELPDEYPDLAAAAYVTAKRGGHSPTQQSVQLQLKARRRDKATLDRVRLS